MIGLQKILINNPHQHPLIYLKGIKYESLKLILRFMYLGETKVSEEELQSFLTAAEELKVKIRTCYCHSMIMVTIDLLQPL